MIRGIVTVYSGAHLQIYDYNLQKYRTLRGQAHHGAASTMSSMVAYSPYRGYLGPDEISFFDYETPGARVPSGFRVEVVPAPEELTAIDLRIEDGRGTPALAAKPDETPTRLRIVNRSRETPFSLARSKTFITLAFRNGVLREDLALAPERGHALGSAGGDWTYEARREQSRHELGTAIRVNLAYIGDGWDIPPGGALAVDLPDIVAQPGSSLTRVFATISRQLPIPDHSGHQSLILERSHPLTRLVPGSIVGKPEHEVPRDTVPFSTALTCGDALDKRLEPGVMALSLSNDLGEAIGRAPRAGAPWIALELAAETLPWPLRDVADMGALSVAYITADGSQHIDLGAPVFKPGDGRAVWALRFFADRVGWLPGAHRTAHIVVALAGAPPETTAPERQTAAAILRWGNIARVDNGEFEVSVPLWQGTPLVGGSGPDWGDET